MLIKSRILQLLLISLSFILITTIGFHENEANAENITDASFATVVNDDTLIGSKYTFIPGFISGKTKVEPFGSGWTLKTGLSGSVPYYAFVPTSDSQKGRQGVIYRNVGTYNGKQVDLKITINDWDQYTTIRGNIAYGVNAIAHVSQGYSSVDQTWAFIDHETNAPINVTGFFTINDIDSVQGVHFSSETTRAIDNIYVTSNSWIQYSDANNRYYFHAPDTRGSSDTDDFALFTMTFTNINKMHFEWKKDYDNDSGWTPDNDVNINYVTGEYFSFVDYKIARTAIAKPEKYTNGAKSGLSLVKDQTLSSYKDDIKYELTHVVNNELSKFYYKDYTIKDNVPDTLKIKSIKVYDQKDSDVTSYFNNETSGNNVVLKAKSSILSSASFYGKTYRVEIITALPDLNKLNQLVSNDVVTWKNKMSVTVGKTTEYSNETTTKLYRRTITTEHIDNMSKKTITSTMEGKKFDGESYSYGPRDDLKYTEDDVEYDYTPISKDKQEGTVKGKNITLYFYYTHPNSDVALKKIQIYTDKASIGLPVKVEFSVKVLEDAKDWEKDEITVALYEKETDKKITSKQLKVGDLSDVLKLSVPPQYLTVNDVKNYEVQLVDNDATKVVFTAGKSKINTDGYTAAEKTLTATNRNASGEMTYKGVVMTKRDIGQSMVRYYETFTIHKIDQPRLKSGYGFTFTPKVTYTNDLLSDVVREIGIQTNTASVLAVDARLIDNSLEYYREGNAKATVPLDSQPVNSGNSVNVAYELPQIYLEKESGLTYSSNQKSKGVIKGKAVNAGHKLYVPVWIQDIGKYDAVFKSKNAIGSNRIQFDVLNKVDVYAYMFSHTDSGTPDDDELLIQPMDQDAANMNW